MEGHSNSFYKSFRPILIFAQVCGLMPLRGIFGSNRGSLRFTWTNPVHLYAIGVSGIALFFDIIFTRENLAREFSVDGFASTVFYTVCLLTSVLFLRLSQNLPDVSREFLRIENSMTEYESPKKLGLRISVLVIVFSLLATVEHGTMGVLHFRRALSAENGTDDVGPAFYAMHFDAVSRAVPYSALLTILLTWANAICTFNWNCLDFFLMGISLELVAKFNQITKRLASSDFDTRSYNNWEKIQKDYTRIVLLTKKLDGILSGIILTSFFSSLYHLSLQLLRSLTISGTFFQRLYFYFSLSYLILRLLSTLFCMAEISEAAKRPKDFLFSLESHCTASLRLLEQILTDDIHFTGSRAFNINRNFVISVIGTIVTYQVVLLQFDSLTGV